MVHAAGELSERVSAGRYQVAGPRKPVDYLGSSLKLSRAEANNRLRLAARFLPSTNPLTYVVTPPSQPVLGSALFSGLVSEEQALVVSGFVDQAALLEKSGTIGAGQAQCLEATLTGHAEVEPPYFLRHLGIRALALLDPDGQKPSEAQRLAKQGISFRRPYRGWVRIDGYLTISQYEQTMACIDWSTNPKRQHSSAQDATRAGSSPPPPEPDSAAPDVAPVSAPKRPPRGTPATGQGWRRPLDPEEVPPRPPNAPPDAIPPTYQGESWFWFPDLAEQDNGWASGPDDGLPGTIEPPADTEPWPHLVNGVWVPEPGSEEDLPGLSPVDPDSMDRAVKDRRTRAQMLLDGMLHCLRVAAGTDKLPMNGGLKTQLYLSLTQEDLDRQGMAGTVDSPYSGQVPLSLFEEEMCSAGVTELLVQRNGEILDIGRTQRLFTFAQRKVLMARDMGCAFPDCMAPPQWTEAHHIVAWQDGGATNVDNGVLCCSLHHHYLHDRGWSVRLNGAVAWFTPPYSEDITGRERRNGYHHDRADGGGRGLPFRRS